MPQNPKPNQNENFVDGFVVCDERAGECRCSKEAGHVEAGDPNHKCHPDRCTGEWAGRHADGTWRPVRIPTPIGPPRPWEFQ